MHNRTTTAQMKKQKVALLTPCMKHSCAPLARQTGDQTPSSTSRSPFSVQIPQRRTKLTADKGMLPMALLITAGSVCIHTSWQKWLSEKKSFIGNKIVRQIVCQQNSTTERPNANIQTKLINTAQPQTINLRLSLIGDHCYTIDWCSSALHLDSFQVDELDVAFMKVEELAITFFISELHQVWTNSKPTSLLNAVFSITSSHRWQKWNIR